MIHKMCHMELTGNSLLLTKKWQVTKSDSDQNESSRVTKSFWFALPSQNKWTASGKTFFCASLFEEKWAQSKDEKNEIREKHINTKVCQLLTSRPRMQNNILCILKINICTLAGNPIYFPVPTSPCLTFYLNYSLLVVRLHISSCKVYPSFLLCCALTAAY